MISPWSEKVINANIFVFQVWKRTLVTETETLDMVAPPLGKLTMHRTQTTNLVTLMIRQLQRRRKRAATFGDVSP